MYSVTDAIDKMRVEVVASLGDVVTAIGGGGSMQTWPTTATQAPEFGWYFIENLGEFWEYTTAEHWESPKRHMMMAGKTAYLGNAASMVSNGLFALFPAGEVGYGNESVHVLGASLRYNTSANATAGDYWTIRLERGGSNVQFYTMNTDPFSSTADQYVDVNVDITIPGIIRARAISNGSPSPLELAVALCYRLVKATEE